MSESTLYSKYLCAAGLTKLAAPMLALLLTLVATARPAFSQEDFASGLYRLERKETGVFYANLAFDLKLQSPVKKWVVYCPQAPELSRQSPLYCRLGIKNSKRKATTCSEQSALKRLVLNLELDAEKPFVKELPLRAEYKIKLFSSKLVSGKATSVEKLSDRHRHQYLLESFSMDYKNPAFQAYLKEQGFVKKQKESDLVFAYRVYKKLCDSYRYHWDRQLDRRVSLTCLRRSTDCAGISYLFCSVLRAQGIPARALIGRYARSSSELEDFSNTFACHVRAEFYAENIGWVPVDIGASIQFRRLSNEQFFGRDNGDLIVLHVDPDLILDSKVYGLKHIRSMQDFRYWLLFEKEISTPPRQILWKVKKVSAS